MSHDPHWSNRHPSRHAAGGSHAVPLLLLGSGSAQDPTERERYQALLAREDMLQQALEQADARIRGVVILPFTAQGPGTDPELQRQGYGAQALILTALPGYDPAIQTLRTKLQAAATACPMHVSAYGGPTIPAHILRGGAQALLASEDAERLEAFLNAHQPETAANARPRYHGLR